MTSTKCPEAIILMSIQSIVGVFITVNIHNKKEIRTKFGKVASIEMAPIMPDNKIFRGENSIKFWVSDDINRVPLKIRAKLFVGAFEVELTDYEGLREDIGKGSQDE